MIYRTIFIKNVYYAAEELQAWEGFEHQFERQWSKWWIEVFNSPPHILFTFVSKYCAMKASFRNW